MKYSKQSMRITFKIITWGLILFASSCHRTHRKYRAQFDMVQNLIYALSKNDTAAIREMIGVDLKTIALNEHMLYFRVKKGQELINHFGVPDESNYIVHPYPEKDYRLIDIIIPIYTGINHSLKDSITVSFVKFLPPNKILDFSVDESFELLDTIKAAVDALRK
jgi:hypothetical protein